MGLNICLFSTNNLCQSKWFLFSDVLFEYYEILILLLLIYVNYTLQKSYKWDNASVYPKNPITLSYYLTPFRITIFHSSIQLPKCNYSRTDTKIINKITFREPRLTKTRALSEDPNFMMHWINFHTMFTNTVLLKECGGNSRFFI